MSKPEQINNNIINNLKTHEAIKNVKQENLKVPEIITNDLIESSELAKAIDNLNSTLSQKLAETYQRSYKKLLLSAEETYDLLNIGRVLFYRLHSEGMIPEPVRLGRRTLWSYEELEAWIKAGCPDRLTWDSIKNQ